MMKLWNLLVYGHHCEHKWRILSQGPIVDSDHKPGDTPLGRYYNLQCEKCGDVKVRNLK